jgi:hypothetical protein
LSRSTLLVILIAVALAGGVGVFIARGRSRHQAAERRAASQLAAAMRRRALSLSAAEVGITQAVTDDDIWGVVADWSPGDGTATVVALADGSTSLYASFGGGVIGGHAHEPVRQASALLIQSVRQARAAFNPTVPMPLPGPRRARFYALSRHGLLGSIELSESELQASSQPLRTVFASLQAVITQLRLISSAGA